MFFCANAPLTRPRFAARFRLAAANHRLVAANHRLVAANHRLAAANHRLAAANHQQAETKQSHRLYNQRKYTANKIEHKTPV